MIRKWKRAVVHLECATDSEHFYDRIKRINQQRALLDQGKITHEQFSEQIAGRSRDIRCHGTALFVLHASRRYLLTARHVVWDERSAKREFEEEVKRAATWSENTRPYIMQSAAERANNNIFNMIFRVPSLDQVLAHRKEPKFLMNLGAGASFTVPYSFSDSSLDLALISLDQRDSRFADELMALGFEPISSDEFADGPATEGQEVFTVGFPSSTAMLGQVSQHPASAHCSSSHFSLPVAAFGKVSMLHDALPFFWADMSIYPGNSGGPVVADSRIIGVVSGQAILPIDDVPEVRTRIPFGRIIKASFVRALLREQEQKDHFRIPAALPPAAV
jgi:hypothetical protein